MAINLLGYTPSLNPMGSSTQTSTPMSSGSSLLKGVGAVGNAALALNNNGGMGVTAKSPTTNVTPPPTTIPKTQQNPVATPAPTNSAGNAGLLGQAASQYTPPALPNYNSSQPATTVYNNGVASTNQNGTQIGGYTPPTQPAQPQAQVPQPTTFAGTTGALVQAAQQGSPNATSATQGLLQAPTQNAGLVSQAQDIGTQYGDNISKIENQGNALAGSYVNGAGLAPVSQGLKGQAEQTTAAEVAGQQAAEQAALNPLDRELTAQAQGQSGLQAAGGIANTQQQNEQSGLQQGASLAQPSATSQGQTTFNPLTGQFSGGSYQNNLQTVVQSIKNGDMGYTAGVDSLSSLSPTAKADVLAALGPGFDTVASDANAATKGSNIQTGGTATTGANAQGLAQSIQQETALNTAANNASALAQQVQTALTNSGLNMTNSTDANTAISNLQSRLGNAAYTQLTIAVNDARNAYASVLQSTGATPTDAGNAANQNINANMSPKQILAAIDQLSQGVNARQQSQHAQTQQYQSQLNGSGSSTGNSGGSVSGFGWTG